MPTIRAQQATLSKVLVDNAEFPVRDYVYEELHRAVRSEELINVRQSERWEIVEYDDGEIYEHLVLMVEGEVPCSSPD